MARGGTANLGTRVGVDQTWRVRILLEYRMGKWEGAYIDTLRARISALSTTLLKYPQPMYFQIDHAKRGYLI